ncbi:hypothetical protein GCM10010334_74040 [Streptomyces finlayi]|uniref:Uncharacterized protein n=1 Tax=Streptomyces finlayi TaxID=67296 RepID=A0A919CEG7_9ACTN|nr:hypothetical protein GCM10010334_74040 [Streptomyces finlayi]
MPGTGVSSTQTMRTHNSRCGDSVSSQPFNSNFSTAVHRFADRHDPAGTSTAPNRHYGLRTAPRATWHAPSGGVSSRGLDFGAVVQTLRRTVDTGMGAHSAGATSAGAGGRPVADFGAEDGGVAISIRSARSPPSQEPWPMAVRAISSRERSNTVDRQTS